MVNSWIMKEKIMNELMNGGKKEEPVQVMDKETLKKFKNIELIKSICILEYYCFVLS